MAEIMTNVLEQKSMDYTFISGELKKGTPIPPNPNTVVYMKTTLSAVHDILCSFWYILPVLMIDYQ